MSYKGKLDSSVILELQDMIHGVWNDAMGAAEVDPQNHLHIGGDNNHKRCQRIHGTTSYPQGNTPAHFDGSTSNSLDFEFLFFPGNVFLVRLQEPCRDNRKVGPRVGDNNATSTVDCCQGSQVSTLEQHWGKSPRVAIRPVLIPLV